MLAKNIIYRLKVIAINFLTAVVGIFIWRDKTIWLFGSWMGNRFSDNTRFLYQYLVNHKQDYCLQHVIWVTRSDAVYDMLKREQYEVYKCGTVASLYWHLKAGVHFVCDMGYSNGRYSGDIDGCFSWGAVKFQLWHGVGIKACCYSTNHSVKHGYKAKRPMVQSLYTPGAWNLCYWLLTSEENVRSNTADFGLTKNQVIVSGYPRNCSPLKLLDSEESVVRELANRKQRGQKVVLYAPTFRDNHAENQFTAPLEIGGFINALADKNITWVEKRHAASTYSSSHLEIDNVVYIDPMIDINVLYDYVDLVVSDYSSATSDALFRGIRVLDYIPDYDYYANSDRGFTTDYYKYHPGMSVKDPIHLLDSIIETLSDDYFTDDRLRRYKDVSEFLFGTTKYSMADICAALISRIKN